MASPAGSTPLLSFASTPPYYPTTFMERGVAVPFTTPMLLGTRVRPGERVTLELVVPNPSGGKGQYIVPWNALHELFRPSLYDRSLQKAVAGLRGVTPGSIRKLTRDVAAEGLAGREAKNAARAAIARDDAALVVTNYYLLLALIREVTPSAQDYGPPTAASAALVENAANRAVSLVGPRLGLDSEGVAKGLEDLAATIAAIGFGPETNNYSRIPQVIARLATLHAQLDEWIAECGDDLENTATLVRACAAMTLKCAEATVEDTRRLANRPVEMLMRWKTDAQEVAAKAVRPEWILDGWESICGIWEAASGASARRSAIAEIAHFVPIVPKEAGDWVSRFDVEGESSAAFRRLVNLNHDWRSGDSVFSGMVRSERILAMNHQGAMAA